MAAATVDSVRLLLAGQLGYADAVLGTADVTKLEPFWTPITAQATDEAEDWLRNTLAAKFGAPAVAVWPMFLHYHRRLAVFLSGMYRTAQLSAEQKSALDRLDCRAEVMALTTLGGVAATTGNGRSSVGELKAGMFARPFVGRCGLPAGPFAEN